MKPICTIKKKYNPDYFVLILILINKKKGYSSSFLPSAEKKGKKEETAPFTSFLIKSEIMIPLITYIYCQNVCFFCNTWEHPVCCNCLYNLHKKKCGCPRTEFFYNILMPSFLPLSFLPKEKKEKKEILFCDDIKKEKRIYYFW